MSSRDENFDLKSFYPIIWDIPQDICTAFVPEVSKWVKVWSKVINAAPSYLAMPLVVLTSPLMQLSTIKVNDYHKKPTVLYALVSGKSGTRKSNAAEIVRRIALNINPQA